MKMEEVAVVLVGCLRPYFTYLQTSFILLLQLIQIVLGTVSAQETEGIPGWPPQPPGPPSAHLEPTAGL